jgi:nitrous oxidase accessory protein NosD
MSVLIVSKAKNHYHSISEAINMAEPGDTISIKPGTYSEEFCINKSLTIEGEGNSSDIIIKSNRNNILSINAEKVTVKNLSFISQNIPR